MSEMLGNYYFQRREYQPALTELVSANKEHMSASARGKVLICLVALNRAEHAVGFLEDTLEKGGHSILNTLNSDYTQLCTDLIHEYEHRTTSYYDSASQSISLGILWLFCNINITQYYFTKAIQICPSNRALKTVLRIISDHINHLNEYTLS